jgi:hypothetical protein
MMHSGNIRVDPKLVPVDHIPINHKYHIKPGVACGCIDPNVFQSKYLSCKYCGAAYDFMEVLSFPVFRCYDCAACEYLGPKEKTNENETKQQRHD